MGEGEGKINVFNLWEKGVVNHKDPLHVVDGELVQSQNVIANQPDAGHGGLEKRGGMAKVNSGVLAGAVQGLINIPLPDPGGTFRTFYWNDATGGPDADSKCWRRSTDGAAWGLAEDIFTPPAAAQVDTVLPWAAGAGGNYRDAYCASLGGRLYYPAFVVPGTTPIVRMYDGATDTEFARIPSNLRVATEAVAIAGIYALNASLYVVAFDANTGAPNLRARVLKLDPETAALVQVGNTWGPDADEAAGGCPQSLAWFQGRLWAGTIGGNGDAVGQIGKVYWIRPGVDTTWTLDHTTSSGQGFVSGMIEFRGDLYVGVSGEAGSAALVLKRTAAGVWSTSKTGSVVTPGADPATYWAGLRVFEDNLYAIYFGTSSLGFKCEAHKFDGTTWTLDQDLQGADVITRWPGMTVVRGDALYVALSSATWKLWRKVGAVWTNVLLVAGTGNGSSFLGYVE